MSEPPADPPPLTLADTTSPPERWLVVRGGALGDFVLTVPAIRAVRQRAAHVTLVCNPRFASPFPGLADRIVDVHGTAAMGLFGSGPLPDPLATHALVYTPGVGDLLRDQLSIPVRSAAPRPAPGQHASDHLFAPVADWATRAPPAPQAPSDVAARWAPLLSDHPVVLAPGAAGTGKRWPHLREVAQSLTDRGVPVVWLPGRDEGLLIPRSPDGGIDTALPGRVLPCPDLCAVVAIAQHCGAWVGMDTGTTHLAAAAGALTLSLFGPTDPACWAAPGTIVLPFEISPHKLADHAIAARARMRCDSSTAPGPTHPHSSDL